MAKSSKLTKRQKDSGKRKLLIPSKETQEKMRPVTFDDFSSLVRKTIPLSQQPVQAEK